MDSLELKVKIPFHPKAKFGLKAILLAIFIIAIGLGSFKYGKEQGNVEGHRLGYEAGWADSQNAKIVAKSYSVSDLVHDPGPEKQTMLNLTSLAADIQQSVDKESWESNGGPAQISVYPQNLSLVVNQTQRGHDAIEEFLGERRLKTNIENQ